MPSLDSYWKYHWFLGRLTSRILGTCVWVALMLGDPRLRNSVKFGIGKFSNDSSATREQRASESACSKRVAG